MFRFRPRNHDTPTERITQDGVRQLIREVLSPAHFYLGPDWQLERQQLPAEEISWEIFQGRLLDPAHTRERRTFEA